MELKMVHKDNDKQVAYVNSQIQREAFEREGFVAAPDKEQPKPEAGEPSTLPADSAETDRFEEVKDDNAGYDVSVAEQLDAQDKATSTTDTAKPKTSRKDSK